jgi:hypothetical protein
MQTTNFKIVLNVYAPIEGKIDVVRDSFYEDLERVFDTFPKYHMAILSGMMKIVSFWKV